ncbi:MAG: efflux RND transporter permease subunit, partial [Pseudolabrys sp.]
TQDYPNNAPQHRQGHGLEQELQEDVSALEYNLLVRGGMESSRAILETGALQSRPVLMTCVIAGVGLLPAAISTGIGSQVQKPLAIVVVSGMTLAPILILIVLPALIAFFPRHTSSAGRLQAQAQPTQ